MADTLNAIQSLHPQSDALVRQVLGRIRDSGTAGRRRPGTRRYSRQRSPWLPLLAAAGIFGAVLTLVVLYSGAETPRPDADPIARPPQALDEPRTAEPPKVSVPSPASGTAPEDKRPEPPPPVEPVPKPQPKSVPASEKPPTVKPPVPPPAPEPPAETPPRPGKTKPETRPVKTVIARLSKVEGQVFLLAGLRKTPIGTVREILPGQGVETVGTDSRVSVAFPDGTRVEVEPDTLVSEFRVDGGKRIELARGRVSADVSKQPKGQPFLFLTELATARVLGTSLRITSADSYTLLEVTEGRVRLTRKSDRRFVDVRAGHYAVAAPGVKMTAKVLPRNLIVDPGFENNGRGWQGKSSTSGISVVDSRARSGRRSLHIRSDGQIYREVFQVVRVEPGETYRVYVRLWVGAGMGGGASATFFEASATTINSENDLPAIPRGAQGWTLIHGRYVAPPNAAGVRIALFTKNETFFDDILVEKVLP